MKALTKHKTSNFDRYVNIGVYRGGSRISKRGGGICIKDGGFAFLILSHFS